MPSYGLWGPTLGLVVGQTWTSIYLGSRVLKRYQLPLSELCQWGKLGLALAASLVALAALHASQLYLPQTPLGMRGRRRASSALVYAIAARIILREEYGYVMRAHPAAEARMSAKPTLLIVSYYYAPSPLVGAKRFSFLAREFARMGTTFTSSPTSCGKRRYGREDHSLPLAGTVHRCAAPFEVPLKGKSASAQARQRRLAARCSRQWASTISGRARPRARRSKSRANCRPAS